MPRRQTRRERRGRSGRGIRRWEFWKAVGGSVSCGGRVRGRGDEAAGLRGRSLCCGHGERACVEASKVGWAFGRARRRPGRSGGTACASARRSCPSFRRVRKRGREAKLFAGGFGGRVWDGEVVGDDAEMDEMKG